MGYAVKLQNRGAKQVFKVANIGSSSSNANRSWNVATVLPAVYKTLTANNFGIYTISITHYQGGSSAAYGNKSFSYNASNGSLSLPAFYFYWWDADGKQYTGYCGYYVRCYYIE